MEITFYPLTNAQKRIWYTEKFYPNTSISNLAGFGKLISDDGVQAHYVEKAIQEFVRRYESMRIRLRLDDEGEPVQYVSEYRPLTIEHTDIRQAEFALRKSCQNGDVTKLASLWRYMIRIYSVFLCIPSAKMRSGFTLMCITLFRTGFP